MRPGLEPFCSLSLPSSASLFSKPPSSPAFIPPAPSFSPPSSLFSRSALRHPTSPAAPPGPCPPH
ncbi:uncharacterized protein K452DRAFT_282451 [Aplosporella prunicola CBS 121167]|uniref:Uncharacterized protein n=1 Tax=Aplosporella prunicola CBS 121167 TaxID=1176127 RepID=A0A6A6BVY1_9PEZI|nr:uncharacterized protein K452DRAFT_282451 [Aplosporella prunicola CBS 121167]KAF2147445.1 hypothetical protein K452DRAFT_282451 [Aplosporella prunicola CBS 121167]